MTTALDPESPDNPAHQRLGLGPGILGSVVALVVPLALLAIPQSDTVALVGAAGSDTGDGVRIVAAAGGSILNGGGRSDVVIARAEGAGFVGRLYAAGARLVLDGRLAGGCGRPDSDKLVPHRTSSEFGLPER